MNYRLLVLCLDWYPFYALLNNLFVLFSHVRLIDFCDHVLVHLMNDGLVNLNDLFLVDDGLMVLNYDVFQLLVDDVLVMLQNHFLMVFVNYVLVVLLNDGRGVMRLHFGFTHKSVRN